MVCTETKDDDPRAVLNRTAVVRNEEKPRFSRITKSVPDHTRCEPVLAGIQMPGSLSASFHTERIALLQMVTAAHVRKHSSLCTTPRLYESQ